MESKNIIKYAGEYQDYLESIREFLIENNAYNVKCIEAVMVLQTVLEEIKRRAEDEQNNRILPSLGYKVIRLKESEIKENAKECLLNALKGGNVN